MKKITIAERTATLRRTLGLTLKQAHDAAVKQARQEKEASEVPRHYMTIERTGRPVVQFMLEGDFKNSSVNAMLEHIERVEREFTGKLHHAPKGVA